MPLAPVHGRFGDVSVATKLLGGFCETIDLNISQDVVTLAVFGGTWKTKLSGLQTATVDLAGYYDATSSTGPMAVLTPLGANDSIAMVLYPAGNTTGNYIATFNAVLKELKTATKIGAAVAWSAMFEVTGSIVWTVHT